MLVALCFVLPVLDAPQIHEDEGVDVNGGNGDGVPESPLVFFFVFYE